MITEQMIEENQEQGDPAYQEAYQMGVNLAKMNIALKNWLDAFAEGYASIDTGLETTLRSIYGNSSYRERLAYWIIEKSLIFASWVGGLTDD